MKMFCSALSSIIVLRIVAFAHAQYSLPDLVERIKPLTATVTTYDSHGKPIMLGSGFFIDSQHIVSNYHVFKGASSAEAKLYDKSTVSVLGIVYQNAKLDQIVVRIKGTYGNIVPIKSTRVAPRQGETVVVIGSPLGLEQSVTDGIVSSIRYDEEYGELVQITAPISSGSSGSPVVNLKGELVGVATFQLIGGQNLNFAIPFRGRYDFYTLGLEPFSSISDQPSSDILPVDSQFLLTAGFLLMDSKYKDALQYFQKCIKANLSNIDAYIGAGQCEWYLQDARSAEKYFGLAQGIDPDNALPYYKIAAFYHTTGDTYSKNVQMLVTKASRLKLKSVEDYLSASDALLKIGYHQKAEGLIDSALLLSKNRIQTYLRLAMMYESDNLPLKKIEALEAVLEIYPSTDNNYRTLAGNHALFGFESKEKIHVEIANTYKRLGMRDKAKLSFERAVMDEPETAEGYYTNGKIFHELGRYRDEIDSYKAAIVLDPEHFQALYALAMLYKELGSPDEAVKFLKKATIIDPDNSSAFFVLGCIYFKYEQYEEAIDSFNQYVRILPEYGTGYYSLGMTYLFAGKKSLALKQVNILKSIDSQLASDLQKKILEYE